jgi:uncharacterized membrane protein YjdF
MEKLFTPGRLALLLFTLAYTVAGCFLLYRAGNTEFLIYLIGLTPLIALGFYVHIRFELPLWMLWLISILFALHLAGGSFMWQGHVLYEWVIVSITNPAGLTIWKFDQFVHPYGAAAVAFISYTLLVARTRLTWSMAFLIAFMIANGAGALNEVIEFITKVISPESTVGGYYNTALDLTFNMLGALLGCLLGLFSIARKEKS